MRRVGPSARSASRLLIVALVAATTPGVSAQDPTEEITAQEEARLLRAASSHEWRGRLDEAEEVLTGLLAAKPTSSGGLFAFERILRTRSRVGEILPHVDRYLEARPDASGPRYMKLRVLVEIDSLDAVVDAAEAWFEAEPGSTDPYREVARLLQPVFGPERALDVLLAGRDAVGDSDALALEIGDARAGLGDAEGAVSEWARALESPRADVDGVLRRLERLDGDRESLVEPVLDVLTRDGASQDRRRAAVRVAIDFELPDLARRLATAGLRGLPRDAAPAFLQEVARRADTAGMADLSLWALSTLQRTVPAAQGDAAAESRLAVAALAAGDTVAALEAQTRMVRALAPGSVERRRALADLIRVEARASSVGVDDLGVRLRGFRSEFPDAPETDELTAVVAAGLATRGDVDGAVALVDPAPGPQSELERAWLLLDGGDVEGGRGALEGALPGLAPTAATEVIQLMAVIDRVGGTAAAALSASAARTRHGDVAGGRRLLDDALDEVGADDRPAVLFQAGLLAAGDDDAVAAAGYFARIEGAHPESREAAEAMLRHARILANDPARTDEARSMLERLILERPRAAVVPDARRELERLGRGS
jgi:tetratricopeptide (TPR) repeat protein